MKITSLKYFLLIIALISIVSCERDADVELPEVDPEIVLRCFISPNDTGIVANVTKSDPVFGSNDIDINEPVSDAIVMISNGIISAVLAYDDMRGAYVIDQDVFPVVAGAEYSMSVDVPGFETVNAQTQVPLSVPEITNWNIVIADTAGQEFEQKVNVEGELFWSMQAAEELFYAVHISRVEGLFTDEGEYFPALYETFFKSLGETNSDQSSFSLNLKSSYYYQGYVEPMDTAFFELYLLSVNRDYYLFNQSIANAGYGDPFSEPTLVYSNVNGGLGVFAAYNGIRSVSH